MQKAGKIKIIVDKKKAADGREFFAAGIRVTLDDRSDKIGYKIREARQVMRVPYMLIIGAKEVENGNVSVRDRDTDETTVMTVDELISKLQQEISERRS